MVPIASIPANVILVWPSTNASIPSGWTRETTLDSKFAKGWGDENPNITGGADTHTHTSTAHSHTIAHTHTYTISSYAADSTRHHNVGTQDLLAVGHAHTGTTGASTVADSSSTAATYAAYSSDPPYRKVIFIKASAGAQLATDIVALYNSNTPPANWSNVTALQDRFLKGAPTGADSDLSTDNGSLIQAHGLNHNHTISAHSHAASTSSTGSGTCDRSPDSSDGVRCDHTHSVTPSNSTEFTDSYTVTQTQDETDIQPAYAKLQAIQKAASGIKVTGIIGLWLGTAASIPNGWELCDGTNGTKDLQNKFIKIGNPSDANGGSNTHTHAAKAHSHTATGHTHPVGALSHAGQNAHRGGDYTADHWGSGSSHSAFNTDSSAITLASANTSGDSSNGQPSYRTAVYIEFQNEVGGGAMLFNFLN